MTTQHFTKYDQIAKALGIPALVALVPFSSGSIQRALDAGDDSLNTLCLLRWDMQHTLVWELYNQAYSSGRYTEPGGWSLCNTICVLKHVAIHYIVGGKQ